MNESSSVWEKVAIELDAMRAALGSDNTRPADLNRFAKHFGTLAAVYLAAITAEGLTSMRAEAVVRALDLKTPKSALLSFLGRGEP